MPDMGARSQLLLSTGMGSLLNAEPSLQPKLAFADSLTVDSNCRFSLSFCLCIWSDGINSHVSPRQVMTTVLFF